MRGSMVGSDAAVPPAAFPFCEIRRQLDRKSALSIIRFLNPYAVPDVTDELACPKSPVFPWIATVAPFVECQPNDDAVLIFPFTGENMAVTGLRHNRGRKGFRGNSPLNRRPDACRYK